MQGMHMLARPKTQSREASCYETRTCTCLQGTRSSYRLDPLIRHWRNFRPLRLQVQLQQQHSQNSFGRLVGWESRSPSHRFLSKSACCHEIQRVASWEHRWRHHALRPPFSQGSSQDQAGRAAQLWCNQMVAEVQGAWSFRFLLLLPLLNCSSGELPAAECRLKSSVQWFCCKSSKDSAPGDSGSLVGQWYYYGDGARAADDCGDDSESPATGEERHSLQLPRRLAENSYHSRHNSGMSPGAGATSGNATGASNPWRFAHPLFLQHWRSHAVWCRHCASYHWELLATRRERRSWAPGNNFFMELAHFTNRKGLSFAAVGCPWVWIIIRSFLSSDPLRRCP